ncbi:tyrosine--tRNA ligase [Candidatus Saccharibacteria bacterium]|nr:tyrosine--tRNA ligase [Candidatus Saccharibacteria bacterium]
MNNQDSNQMSLSEELQWRGFINQTTFKNLDQLDEQQWTFYHGFDASAPSQQIGNLAAMMFDKVFMRHGHKAIILAGGATSLIGDPGGKDKERELQAVETIADNVRRAEAQFSKIYRGSEYTLVNNLDWTKNLNVIDYLRDIGKHYSMTPLVQRDFIAKRMNEGGDGITYAEFSYTVLQGMDFLHLFDKYGCTLQLGGSDQWGNCLSGVDLIRKTRGKEAHVITLPLIINSQTGKKFGKSEDGAVWLDPELTSPFKFYQFWLNVDDQGVETYLKVYTELSKSEIDDVLDKFKQDRAARLAQKTLAKQVTNLVHGEDITKQIIKVTELLFSEDYTKLDTADFELLRKELPAIQNADQPLIDLLVASNLASSKTEARRFINDGAVYINGDKLTEDTDKLSDNQFISGHAIVRRGKNNLAIISK